VALKPASTTAKDQLALPVLEETLKRCFRQKIGASPV
jgi:hypothetical protein